MTTTTASSYNLEQGAYAGMPSLVGKAMGPARSWFQSALEWVCGDPELLRSTGQQYVELGRDVSNLSMDLGELVADVPTWQGPAATAYRSTMTEAVDVVNKVGGFVGTTNEILVAAAEVAVEAANLIWDIVVELVKWLVTTLMKAMAASTFSLGASIAAWLASAIGQVCAVVTKVAQVVGKVGTLLMKIVTLLQKLAAVITKYKAVLDKIQQLLSRVKQLGDRFGDLSDRVDHLPGGGTWADYRRTVAPHQVRGLGMGDLDRSVGGEGSFDPGPIGTHDPTTSVRRPVSGGTLPATPVGRPDGTPPSYAPDEPPHTPEWTYQGGHDYTPGGTVAAGVDDSAAGVRGQVGSLPTTGGGLPADPAADRTGGAPGVTGTWEYGNGRGPASTSAGVADGRVPTPAHEVTRAAGLTGGVGSGTVGGGGAGGGVGGGSVGGPRLSGTPGVSAAGATPGPGGLTGGVGAMPGAGMAAMPLATASGGSGDRNSRGNSTGPMAAPLGAGLGRDKDKPKAERGRGPLQNARIGEEDGTPEPSTPAPAEGPRHE